MILPCDSRFPPYRTATTRPARSNIGLPEEPGAPYPSTCTRPASTLLTVPTVSVGSATTSRSPRRAAPDVDAHDAEVRGIGDADQATREPLPAPRELDRDPLRPAAAVLPQEHVLVGDEGALGIDRERGAGKDLPLGERDDEQGHGVLVLLRDGAVIDGRRPGQPALARLGGVELRAQPVERRRVMARARR